MTQEAGIHQRLAALNEENNRLEQENKEFRDSNQVLRELLPQMPYISTPPAQLALPQFWQDNGHFAHPAGVPHPGLDGELAPFNQIRPAPADPATSEYLKKKHQPYLEERQKIIDAREAEFTQLQQQLQQLDFNYKSKKQEQPDTQHETPLYAERAHSRLEFGSHENYHREYAARWKDRPERAAAGHT